MDFVGVVTIEPIQLDRLHKVRRPRIDNDQVVIGIPLRQRRHPRRNGAINTDHRTRSQIRIPPIAEQRHLPTSRRRRRILQSQIISRSKSDIADHRFDRDRGLHHQIIPSPQLVGRRQRNVASRAQHIGGHSERTECRNHNIAAGGDSRITRERTEQRRQIRNGQGARVGDPDAIRRTDSGGRRELGDGGVNRIHAGPDLGPRRHGQFGGGDVVVIRSAVAIGNRPGGADVDAVPSRGDIANQHVA